MDFEKLATLFVSALPFFGGIIAIGFSLYWLFDRKAKLRHLAMLREKLEKLSPTDPEYDIAKALYVSALASTSLFSSSDSSGLGNGDGFDSGHHHFDGGSHGDSGGDSGGDF